jgi:hypothetical protein
MKIVSKTTIDRNSLDEEKHKKRDHYDRERRKETERERKKNTKRP